MLSVSVTEYDIADVRPLFGKAQDEPAARTVPGPMTSVRPVRPYIRPYDDQTNEKRTATMKLSSTLVSVDGVMQGSAGR